MRAAAWTMAVGDRYPFFYFVLRQPQYIASHFTRKRNQDLSVKKCNPKRRSESAYLALIRCKLIARGQSEKRYCQPLSSYVDQASFSDLATSLSLSFLLAAISFPPTYVLGPKKKWLIPPSPIDLSPSIRDFGGKNQTQKKKREGLRKGKLAPRPRDNEHHSHGTVIKHTIRLLSYCLLESFFIRTQGPFQSLCIHSANRRICCCHPLTSQDFCHEMGEKKKNLFVVGK